MTDSSVEPIVSFDEPPVAEVVTAVKFSPMSPAAFFGLGGLWSSSWSEEFPNVEFRPLYGAPIESFEQNPRQPGFQFSFAEGAALPRVWVSSEDGAQLLQFQTDWFAANWRRDGGVPAGSPAEYDRWPARRQAFVDNWGQLVGWLQACNETVALEQCEVTYINHIRPIAGLWSDHSDASRVFDGIGQPSAGGLRSELFNWRAQYVLEADGDLPESRLHASIGSGFVGPGPEPVPAMVFELTVRGAPGEGDLLHFYDRGRKAIVETFVELTSSEAREAWGQG